MSFRGGIVGMPSNGKSMVAISSNTSGSCSGGMPQQLSQSHARNCVAPGCSFADAIVRMLLTLRLSPMQVNTNKYATRKTQQCSTSMLLFQQKAWFHSPTLFRISKHVPARCQHPRPILQSIQQCLVLIGETPGEQVLHCWGGGAAL